MATTVVNVGLSKYKAPAERKNRKDRAAWMNLQGICVPLEAKHPDFFTALRNALPDNAKSWRIEGWVILKETQ